MVHNTQNYYISAFCPSSVISKIYKTQHFWKLDMFQSSGEGRLSLTLLGPLERVNQFND
jgi:hypothetical protein